MIYEILVIFCLLLLNGFFALSELAIVSSSKPLLKQYAKQGKKGAASAVALADNLGRFLSTVQVGITLVGILAGAYGGATIAEKLAPMIDSMPLFNPHGEGIAVFVVVMFITYFSVVIGELVPKQLALNNPERFAMIVAKPMRWVSTFCRPVVFLLESSGAVIMKILRIKTQPEEMTETEIKAVVEQGAASGAIEQEEHEVIKRVMRLGDRDVRSIMTHRGQIAGVTMDDSLEDLRAKVGEAGHARYPVIDREANHVLGVISAKRIFAHGGDPATFKVADVLRDIATVYEAMPLIEALNLFRTQNLDIAAVVDEQGGFEGIFTVADLMEAIVGVLPSNYGVDDEPLIVRREDGSFLVDGLAPIAEVQIALGLDDIPESDEYKTIAGFTLQQLRELPKSGKAFTFANHRFEIVDMDRHRIDKLLIAKLPDEAREVNEN